MRQFLILSVLALAACTKPTRSDGTCPQTYEFGNYGCAVVRGIVRDSAGAPMPGVPVGLGVGADGIAFAGEYMDSRSDGTFEVRLIRLGPPSPGAEPMASVWIRATVRPVLPALVSTVRDSVLVSIRVSRVGAYPDTTTVVLRPKAA